MTKMFTLIFAKRIKVVMDEIIDEAQSGFMKNRHISNKIRLILDLLDYSDICSVNSLILFLDFYKAFDSIEHAFIFHSLEKLGFGDFFAKAVRTMYNKANCSVKLKSGTSPRFEIQRGIRQGCPISPYLFLLCAQLLNYHIKSSNLKGIDVADKKIIISQLADDTALFLRDSTQVPIAIKLLQSFSAASGPHLNINKCELLAIKDCLVQEIGGIPVKEKETYLGIVICKNEEMRSKVNFDSPIIKMKKKLNCWLLRDLSLRGRVLLTKAEGISRLTHAATSLDVPDQIAKTIDNALFNFIWKNNMNTYESGGLNFLNFPTLNNTFKINWIKQFIKNPNSLWNFLLAYIFSKLGGLKFILLCNFKIAKLPVKLFNYHKQMLLAWSLIYKHNFSPHQYFIWKNYNILYKNKSLFFSRWFSAGILLNKGLLMNYTEFLATYGIPVTLKEFSVVMDAIPSGVLMMFRGETRIPPTFTPVVDPINTPVGKICFSFDLKNNNKSIRALFQKDIVSVPHAIFYWNQYMRDLD